MEMTRVRQREAEHKKSIQEDVMDKNEKHSSVAHISDRLKQHEMKLYQW